MSSPVTTSGLTAAEGYRLWANTYDQETNPMLSLERRILEPLLPPLAGLDIVDLGCGTGRWLEVLSGSGARSLLGVDFSPEMLNLAESKLHDQAKIVCADCANAPLAEASADLVLCNFVLSYVESAGHFLQKVSRALRPGGSFFLSDVHPETAVALNWRRGVHAQNEFREIRTQQRMMNDVISLCVNAHLEIAVLLEPRFGEEERALFEKNGKGEYFDSITEFPAIYILQVRAPKESPNLLAQKSEPPAIGILHGARFALNPTASFKGEMRISSSRIESLCNEGHAEIRPAPLETSVDLRGYLALPGLINAHDHLEFALLPRLGKGGYKNFLEWADDIHHPAAPQIAELRKVPREVRLWWGGIRNLLCGVTTVCHHNPYEPEVFTDDFVVRVLKEYGWAHSLPLEPAAALKKRETPGGQPFFIHLAEGTDEESAEEIFDLQRAGALDEDTVIIHGLGMSEKGSALLRSAKAGLIWCPSSNLFLLGKTLSPEQIRKFPKTALGSDSPLTAQGDLLDEIRCACETLQTPSTEIYGYVTRQAAGLLHLRNGEGNFGVGGFADLIAVRDSGLSPAETLPTLSYRDVELVLLGGCVQLASPELFQRLPATAREGLQPLLIESDVRWIRAPLERLFSETVVHLRDEIYLGGRQVGLGS